MQSELPDTYALLLSLGETCLKRLTHALLARDGHFSALYIPLCPMGTEMWSHLSLCSRHLRPGKLALSYSFSSVLGMRTFITAEPNLPLTTAADTICDIPIRMLLKPLWVNMPAASLLVFPLPLPSIISLRIALSFSRMTLLCAASCSLGALSSAIFAVIILPSPTSSPKSALPLMMKRSRAGKLVRLKETFLNRLAGKAVGFLGRPSPRLLAEMVASFATALRSDSTLAPLLSDRATPFDILSVLSSLPSCRPLPSHQSSCRRSYWQGWSCPTPHPHSLRCAADPYFTQVAMHHPHRAVDKTVAYGHCEDPLPEQAASRQCQDMQGNLFHCTGYRLLHWSPTLRTNTHLSSRDVVGQIAAVISFYIARSVRLDNESSKLFLLSPHNGTISDLEDALAARTFRPLSMISTSYVCTASTISLTVSMNFPVQITTTRLSMLWLIRSPTLKSTRIFLDICSGVSKPLSSALCTHNKTVLAIDILLHSSMNLLNDEFFEQLLRLCSSGTIAYCATAP